MYIIDIEDQRLFVARLRLGRIQAQGWVDKRHVANCFDTVPQFDPEFTGKAVVGFRPYLAIAQARYEVTLTPGTVTSTGTWTRIDECLEAAERLAPRQSASSLGTGYVATTQASGGTHPAA